MKIHTLKMSVLSSLSAWAVYPQTRYLSQRARLFIDFLAGRFGDKPYWDARVSHASLS